MELNRELRQRCWLEVMRFAQDDSLTIATSFSLSARDPFGVDH